MMLESDYTQLCSKEGVGTRSKGLRGDPRGVVVSGRSPKTLASRTSRFAARGVSTAGTAPHSPITRTLSSVPYFDLLCFLPFRFLCSPPFRHGKARPARGRPEENCRVYHRAPSLPPELDSNVILCKR